MYTSHVPRNLLSTILIAAALAAFPLGAFADVRLPAIIADNMVLQQQSDVALWGWAKPGETVHVKADWLKDEINVKSGDDGRWSTTLRTPDAGGPHTLTFSAGNTITLSNVLIGEVWLCSGQSNMEWSFHLGINNGKEEQAAANYPQIRLFNVKRVLSPSVKDDLGGGAWQPCTPESVYDFSVVAYFFGRELHRELNVPIGLIASDWGGTVAEAWTSAATLRKLGDFNEQLDLLAQEYKEPGFLEKEAKRRTNSWWKELAAKDAEAGADQWMSADFDDRSWPNIAVPGNWQSPDLFQFDGIVWQRRVVEIPDAWAGKELQLDLGPIDDMDTTYWNGQRVGASQQFGVWNTPREYQVPGKLVKAGKNILAIRIVDTGGYGGLHGEAEKLRVRLAGNGDAEAVSLAGDWKYHASIPLRDLRPMPTDLVLHPNQPTVLYNAMIAPLVPFGMRGAIWYQGESNRERPYQYSRLFPAMIDDWRGLWGSAFPFYYVQIAPYSYGGDVGEAGALRDAQRRTLATPNTGMAVTLDIGNVRDIHPRDKVPVGHRLALWALANTYGHEDLPYSGPLYRSMKIDDGRVRLTFDHTYGGLKATGELAHFEIAGADRKYVPAEAKIDGDDLIVWSDQVAEPAAVRYTWGATDEATLFNKIELPASTFCTDDAERALKPVEH